MRYTGYNYFCPIKTLHIPASVQIIGHFAFAFCEKLNNLQFNQGDQHSTALEIIGHGAFLNCPLDAFSVRIPPTVTTIAPFCFDSRKEFGRCLALEFHEESQLTQLSQYAFANRPWKSITLPPQTKEVCDFCFAGCHHLEAVALNAGLVHLRQGSFFGCALSFVTIPGTVRTIGDSAFANCEALHKVCFEVQDDLLRIGAFAFYQTSLETLTIPKSVEMIGQCCFGNCHLLATVRFAEGSQLDSIGPEAFAGTENLSADVVLPSQVTFLGSACFSRSAVTKVSFEATTSIATIGFSPFAGSRVRTITIPSSIESLGPESFTNCKELTKVEFESSSSLRRIGVRAFQGSEIKSIEIPAKVEVLQESCFADCQALLQVTFATDSQLAIIEKSAFAGSALTELSLPGSVRTLGESCFSSCRSLATMIFADDSVLETIEPNVFENTNISSIKLPSSVRSLSALSCSGLQSIEMSEDSQHFVISDGLLMRRETEDSREFRVLIRNFNSSPDLKIPADVEIIGEHSFALCITISCVEFSKQTRLRRIEAGAFAGSSVVHLYPPLPTSVEVIGDRAFADCKQLAAIQFMEPSKTTRIGSSAFAGSALSRISLPVSVTELGPLALSHCSCQIAVTFEADTAISCFSDRLFADSVIRSLILPNSVTQIGEACFQGCDIAEIQINDDSRLETIGKYAFQKSKLTSIRLRRRVKQLGECCFEKCTSLSKIEIDPKAPIEIIPEGCFANSGICRIRLPDAVQAIADSAFEGCSSLRSVTTSSRLTLIERRAFVGCKFTKFDFPESLSSVDPTSFLRCPVDPQVQTAQLSCQNNLLIHKTAKLCICVFGNTNEIQVPPTVVDIGPSCFAHSNAISFQLSEGLIRILPRIPRREPFKNPRNRSRIGRIMLRRLLPPHPRRISPILGPHVNRGILLRRLLLTPRNYLSSTPPSDLPLRFRPVFSSQGSHIRRGNVSAGIGRRRLYTDGPPRSRAPRKHRFSLWCGLRLRHNRHPHSKRLKHNSMDSRRHSIPPNVFRSRVQSPIGDRHSNSRHGQFNRRIEFRKMREADAITLRTQFSAFSHRSQSIQQFKFERAYDSGECDCDRTEGVRVLPRAHSASV
jgi:hypothetical protein